MLTRVGGPTRTPGVGRSGRTTRDGRDREDLIIESRIPLRLVLGLALAIVLDTLVQVFWKSAVISVDAGREAMPVLQAVFHQPVFLLVAAMWFCQLLNWLKVLDQADLSFAQPITSLSYVTVCLASAVYLGERIDILQMLGIALILAGVWLVSRSGHLSPPAGQAGP
ncbi:MAG: EamA family transporter [Telmatospirillum sp.]|nr:EamA family transporter [Telmatospirillum sp.]